MPGSDRRTKAATGRIVAALEPKLVQFPNDADLLNADAWIWPTKATSTDLIRMVPVNPDRAAVRAGARLSHPGNRLDSRALTDMPSCMTKLPPKPSTHVSAGFRFAAASA